MSRLNANLALDQINLRPSLIAARYAQSVVGSEVTSGMLADLRQLAATSEKAQQELEPSRRESLAGAYGFSDPQNNKPFVFVDGIAVIPIHGMLINRFNWSFGFVTGYQYIRRMVLAAVEDPDVKRIVYDVNSYGGMVAGCQETSDIIYQARRGTNGKPSLAVVDANCYSAAYMLASAAGRIVTTPTGGAGSIGVLITHIDVSKALEEAGVKITFIYSGDHKVDGNAYEPLSEDVIKDLQAESDKIYGRFVRTVVRNRPKLTEEQVRATQARIYQADDALDLGLIDSIAAPPDALTSFSDDSFLDEDDDETQQKEDDMATAATANVPAATAAAPATATGTTPEQTAADAATAANAARQAERARVKAITTHTEAESRTGLANYLAMETDLSPEAAAGIMAAAPKEQKAAAAAAQPPATTAAETNHFQNAMNASKNPEVGADQKDSAESGGKQKVSERVLASQAKATGYKPKQDNAA